MHQSFDLSVAVLTDTLVDTKVVRVARPNHQLHHHFEHVLHGDRLKGATRHTLAAMRPVIDRVRMRLCDALERHLLAECRVHTFL